MSEFKGTPKDNWQIIETPNDIDFDFEISGICAIYRHNGVYSPRNARLISAAPELLEALQSALCELKISTNLSDDNVIEQAEAAIKKALGE